MLKRLLATTAVLGLMLPGIAFATDFQPCIDDTGAANVTNAGPATFSTYNLPPSTDLFICSTRTGSNAPANLLGKNGAVVMDGFSWVCGQEGKWPGRNFYRNHYSNKVTDYQSCNVPE